MIFFKPEEVEGLNENFVAQLTKAREIAAVPFVITSGFRTLSQNQSAGGVENSAHMVGLAVDLRASEASERFLIVKALLAAGFFRIGIYDKHVHVDASLTLPQRVIWLGLSR